MGRIGIIQACVSSGLLLKSLLIGLPASSHLPLVLLGQCYLKYNVSRICHFTFAGSHVKK